MTAPYSPYSSDELDQLERQRQMLAPQAAPPAAVDPMAGIGYDQTTAAEPPGAPVQPPLPVAQPLDLAATPTPALPTARGMATTKVETQGIPDAERAKLEDLHKQLTGEQLGQIDAAGQSERTVHERGLAQANATGIQAANQEVYKQRALEESQKKQIELKKQQDAWTQQKIDGSASKAFEGNEWAQVLTGIGMAAGTFSMAMGWQKSNPLGESFQRTIDQSVERQKDQRNSRLNLLAARLGDEKAAELQVRGEMHDAIATRLAAQAQGTQHQDALDRLAPLIQDQQLKAKESQLNAAQALAPKQTIEQTPVKPKGGEDAKKLKEALEIDALLEKQGRTPEQRQAVLKSAGFSLPDKGGLTASEQTNKEQADAVAAKEKAAADKVGRLSDEGKKDLRTRLDGLADQKRALDELDTLTKFKRDENGKIVDIEDPKGVIGVNQTITDTAANAPHWAGGEAIHTVMKAGLTPEESAVRSLRDQLAVAKDKATSGRVNETSLKMFQGIMPLSETKSFANGAARTEDEWRTTIKNLKAEYGDAYVEDELKSRGIPAASFKEEEKPVATTPETRSAVQSDLEKAYEKLRRQRDGTAPLYR